MSETKIKVAVRLRPPLLLESVVEEGFMNLNEERGSIEIRNTVFTFDHVFDPSVSNRDVYKTLVSHKIKHLFEGFNCTILAYGSTGSGKTFTMGTASNVQDLNGLIPLGLKDIFEYADSIANETDVVIKASFFEIYMENIKDLLKTGSSFVPGDSKEAKISNITEIAVKTFDEAMQTLRKGVQARTTGVTAKNPKSSRSHAFFIVSLVMTDKNSRRSIFSKFQLVDLAGSERTGNDATGKEFKQGVQINKGLTALGRVICSLSKRERHIPYRDSILTRYLQESFGGNSYTVMVTCISPALANVEETLSSLRYSFFAKKIKNTITVNRASSDLIEHLKSELDKLRKMGNCEEKEEHLKKINYLNDHLDKATINYEKIHEKVVKFSASIQLLEEKMVSEAYHQPFLKVYLEILRDVKKDLNSVVNEQKFYCSSPDKSVSSSILELSASSDMLSSDEIQHSLKETESMIETLDDKFLEMEMKNYENLKLLYDFLPIETEYYKNVDKLNGLVDRRELLSKSASCRNFEPGEIVSIDEEIQLCQQQIKLGNIALKKKNEISKYYSILRMKFQELKREQKLSLQKEVLQNNEASSTEQASLNKNSENSASNDSKCTKLEQRLIDLEERLEKLKEEKPYQISCKDVASLDIDDESIGYINHCFHKDVQVCIHSYEIRLIKWEMMKELEDDESPFKKKMQLKEAQEEFNQRISICEQNLETFRERNTAKISELQEDTARFLLDALYTRFSVMASEPEVIKSLNRDKLESAEDPKKISEDDYNRLKFELEKVKNEKMNLESLYQKKILDLNTEWESKTLLLLENAKKETCCVSNRVKPNLPVDVSKFLEDIWNMRDNKYETKCKEVDELKAQVEALQKDNHLQRTQLRQLKSGQLKLPILAARRKFPENKKSEPANSSMIEAFLSDNEPSFTQESERFDPDYRGTPVYKRSKSKRKAPEDDTVLLNPKPSKNLSTSGCSCPSDCGTMRCSCKKKRKECSAFCECNKAKCLNTPSSHKQ